MSRNPYSGELYKFTRLLAQQVSENDPFFKEIALMDVDNRTLYSILHVLFKEIKIFELDISKMSENEIIEKVIMPFVQRLGQSRFRADPLTHLGMKLGTSTKRRDWE